MDTSSPTPRRPNSKARPILLPPVKARIDTIAPTTASTTPNIPTEGNHIASEDMHTSTEPRVYSWTPEGYAFQGSWPTRKTTSPCGVVSEADTHLTGKQGSMIDLLFC